MRENSNTIMQNVLSMVLHVQFKYSVSTHSYQIMANDWEWALACTNSIKHHTRGSRHENPIGFEYCIKQTEPKKASSLKKSRPQIPASLPLSPFLLTRMAIRSSEEEGARSLALRWKGQKNNQHSHCYGWEIGCALNA